ncbi:MAG: metallophosphoesterase [Ruminococcaceae bacterium]|nr:metallophosphoesterase [Oscillospiraceae bacterium]
MKIINKKRHLIKKIVKAVFVLFVLWIILDNILIHTTVTNVTIKDLPKSFDEYRIVQVSDLHNNVYGFDQSYLLSKIRDAKPDIIVVTGDLIDRNTANVDNAMLFINGAVEIAPVFYVTGNHEASVGKPYVDLVLRLHEAGVTILDNDAVSLISEEDVITLAGVRDPAFDWSMTSEDRVDAEIKQALEKVSGKQVTILLSHRPELIKTYSSNEIDLVLTGHAHGGQVRLPFVGPIYSPSQGLFPKFTSGLYEDGGTKMYVSRGIGNGIAPLRFNDGPELPVIVLVSER